MAYGPNLPEMFKRMGTLVDRLLKGAAVGEMPIERPARFDLVVNHKTATALGLTIPLTLLARAKAPREQERGPIATVLLLRYRNGTAMLV
jgi:ABC-type uncharacterized transport system substrate-binding protein